MITALMQIAITEAQGAVERMDEGSTLEDRLLKAMKATKRHWLVTDDNQQFLCGIGAVLVFYGSGSEEHARISDELDGLKKIAAIQQAATAGLSVNIPDEYLKEVKDKKPIGLLKIWHSIK